MAMFIILTSGEADIVRESIYSVIPRYQPIRRADDKYILPVSILSASAHEQWWEFLGELPQLDHNDPAFPGPYEPLEE